MKKLTIIILTIGTILLSGCGTNQKQVNSENKSLSQENISVSSGKKVKNLTKHDNLGNNTKQEKQAVKKTDKKQDNEVGTVKTLVANTEENKSKQNEATEQNETDNTGVEVEYKVKELTDYNHCLISKEDFENMQKAVRKLFSGDNNNDFLNLVYGDLCLPKYKLIGTIKRGDPDTITVESCHDGKPYTLKNFKKGDKKFEYNIAYGYGNVCIEDNISYEFSFYKNGEKLNKVNPKKQLFSPDEENIIYKQGDKVCKIGGPKCWEVENNKIVGIDWGLEGHLYLDEGEYNGSNYTTLIISSVSSIIMYTFFDNGDTFLGKLYYGYGARYNISFKSFNIRGKNLNSKKYITNNKYLKYVNNGYKLCFFGKNDITGNGYNSLLYAIDSTFGENIYIAGTIYTGYVDSGGFLKVICKHNIKNVNFGTNFPLRASDGSIGALTIEKVSVGKSLLEKLGINTLKLEQDITNHKNLKNILNSLLSSVYEGCYEEGMIDKKRTCKAFFPGGDLTGKLDKSKIKKIILKLKPEHYPFGEERYLYEVWINGEKISAEKYFKKDY